MGRYLSERVVDLLRKYLTFCNVCGFIIFTYNEDKDTFRIANWQRRFTVVFGWIYLLIYLPLIAFTLLSILDQQTAVLAVSTITANFNLIYVLALQRYRAAELKTLLNSFPIILKEVHCVTHRKIIFKKLFILNSVVRFLPAVVIFLLTLTYDPPLIVTCGVILIKVLPSILVEIIHHSVYIALYIVAQMYNNLNKTLSRTRMTNSMKFATVYLNLYRFTEELNKLLTGYLCLHLMMDLAMILTVARIMLLNQTFPPTMIYIAASTVNKIRCLIFVADDINERSKYYQKVGVCTRSIEFFFVQIDFRLYCLHRIDKEMFFKIILTLAIYFSMASRYIQFVRKFNRIDILHDYFETLRR